jgi:hypothetical protein
MRFNLLVWLSPFIFFLLVILLYKDHAAQVAHYGKGRWRFSLRGLFVLTTLAAVWLSLATYEHGKVKARFAGYEKLQAELLAMIGTGQALRTGQGWMCVVQRPGFSDDDLERLISAVESSPSADNGILDLRLNSTAVTDAGLTSVARCRNFTFIDLSNLPISDAGLEHLKGLSRLQWLFLNGTRTTGAGIKKLRQALPKCTIEK